MRADLIAPLDRIQPKQPKESIALLPRRQNHTLPYPCQTRAARFTQQNKVPVPIAKAHVFRTGPQKATALALRRIRTVRRVNRSIHTNIADRSRVFVDCEAGRAGPGGGLRWWGRGFGPWMGADGEVGLGA